MVSLMIARAETTEAKSDKQTTAAVLMAAEALVRDGFSQEDAADLMRAAWEIATEDLCQQNCTR